MENTKTNKFGTELARVISSMKLSQSQFGEPLGIDRSKVSALIRGSKPIGLDLLERIISHMNMDDAASLVAAYFYDRTPARVSDHIQIVAGKKGRIPERVERSWRDDMLPKVADAFEYLHQIHANEGMETLIVSLAEALGKGSES